MFARFYCLSDEETYMINMDKVQIIRDISDEDDDGGKWVRIYFNREEEDYLDLELSSVEHSLLFNKESYAQKYPLTLKEL